MLRAILKNTLKTPLSLVVRAYNDVENFNDVIANSPFGGWVFSLMH